VLPSSTGGTQSEERWLFVGNGQEINDLLQKNKGGMKKREVGLAGTGEET